MSYSPSSPSSPESDSHPDTTPQPSHLVDRMFKAAEKGVAVLVRQSSTRQIEENPGSGYFQWDQLRHLETYGIDPDEAEVFDLRGETGRAGADRPDFKELLSKVRAGLFGVVIVTLADRMARNQQDTNRLVNALQSVNGMLVVNGRIYDPTDLGHRLILGILAQIARHDNEMRVLRSLTSKAALAHRMELAIPLPTGLVWASPGDPAFREALDGEGMQDLVTEEALSSHGAAPRKDGERQYALPFPDQEVQQALHLTLSWLLETRDLNEVLRRIREGEGGWPRKGQFPHYGSRRFDPSYVNALRRRGELWRQIVDREDGKDNLARGKLKEFLRSPALFGVYAYSCEALTSISRTAARISEPVWVEDAFPGLFDAELRDEVLGILAEPVSFSARGSYEGPRNHAFPIVRCAELLPDGTRCGLKRFATYRARNRARFRYKGTGCYARDHSSSCTDALDEVGLDIVESAYQKSALEHSLQQVRQSRSVVERERRRLESKIADAEGRLDAAAAKAEAARTEGDRTLEKVYDRRVKEHHETLRATRRELKELEADKGDGDLTRAEKERLLALATDVPRLLRKVRRLEMMAPEKHEGATRRLMNVLTEQVHARRLGAFCHHVEVEFPSGATRADLYFSRELSVPQAALAYAFHRVGRQAGADERRTLAADQEVRELAEQVATEMNAAAGESHLETPWTEERVLMGALMYARQRRRDAPTTDRPTTLGMLSEKLEIEEDKLLGAALRGQLGHAWIDQGEFFVDPSEEDLHGAFDSLGTRAVAEQRGWDPEHVVLLPNLRNEHGLTWAEAEGLARRTGGIARDAAGRRWCRRSCNGIDDLQRSIPSRVARALREHLPAGAEPGDGDWKPLKDVLDEFGVHRATAKKHGTVARPGCGYLGSRSVYIWVDETLRAKLG